MATDRERFAFSTPGGFSRLRLFRRPRVRASSRGRPHFRGSRRFDHPVEPDRVARTADGGISDLRLVSAGENSSGRFPHPRPGGTWAVLQEVLFVRQRSPADGGAAIVEIDRSFVQDVTVNNDDAAIIAAIVSLARTLKLDIVAEGVETAEQARTLADQGCRIMQGFYFSRPVPADALTRLLTDGAKLHGKVKHLLSDCRTVAMVA